MRPDEFQPDTADMATVAAESKVWFRIISTRITPTQVSDQLRLQPSETHNVGDITHAGTRLAHSVWSLQSPLGTEREIGDHLKWFANVLRERVAELHDLVALDDVSFFCTYHLIDSDYGGFTLSPAAMAIAMEFGIRIECHVMCLADTDSTPQ